MADTRTYTLLLAEPSEIVAAGIRKILSGSEFRIADICTADAQELAAGIARFSPDIVMVNPSLIAGELRRGTMPAAMQECICVAVVYSLFDEEQMRGFDAAVSIFDPAQQVLRKLRKALDNGASAAQSDAYELSEREREILVSVARGWTNKEIADRHNISIHTVISHRKNISRKTGIKTIAGLTVYALLNNMIDESDME